MFDDGKKKRLIIGIGVGVLCLLIIIISLLFIKTKDNDSFLGGIFNPNDNSFGVGGYGDTSGVGISGSNGNTNKNPSDSDSVSDVIIPSKQIKGKIDNFVLEGNYGKLDIVDGDTKSSVELKIGGILFDTSVNKVISAKDLKVGSNIDVYTYSDIESSKLDIDLAEVLVVSPKDNMGYTPIENFKNEDGKISFSSKGKEYVIEGKIYSALSGDEYSERRLEELSNGDRVIYYGVEENGKVIINSAYIYPNFN